MHSLALAVIIVPFIGAVACLAVRDRASKPVAVIVSLFTALGAVFLAGNMRTETFLFGAMPWIGQSEGLFGYKLDALAYVMIIASTVIGVLVTMYSVGYLSEKNKDHATKEGHARYFFWLMMFIGSMVGLAVAPSLLQLLIFWELTTLCSWALISFYNNGESLKAGTKALVMTSFGGLFLLAGVVWVLSATGSINFDSLNVMSPGVRAGAFALFLIAAWAKSAQVPLGTWLPDAMAAPTPISAFLHAAAMVKAGVYLIARLLLSGWELPTGMGLLVSIAAIVTMFAALYFYFYQDDLKRLLAYSTIAQLGYIMLGLGLASLGSSVAMKGAVLHILMHGFAKTMLFLSVGMIAYATGTRSLSKLSGLGKSMPVAALSFFVGAFAISGIPPLACFWSKLYILAGSLEVPGAFGPIALILVVLESLITFGWFLWVGQKIFFGEKHESLVELSHNGDGEGKADGLKVPFIMKWVMLALVVLTILIPIVGIPLVANL